MNTTENSKLDFLLLIVKWRKFLFINFIIVSIIAVGVSFMLPHWYVGKVTILPPIEEEDGLGISSMLSGLPIGGLGLGAASFEANIVIAILQSRTLLEDVALKFNLQERFKTEDIEKTLKEMGERVDYKLHEEGTITISTKVKTSYFPTKEKIDEARLLSRDLVDYTTSKLDSINKKIRRTKAANNRSYIEKRYFQNIADLEQAEEDMRAFQEKYGALAVPEQTIATIEALATIQAQQVAKEVELGILESYLDPSHAQVKQVKTEIKAFKSKLDEFNRGFDAEHPDGEMKVLLPLDGIPELGVQYARLYREIEMQALILEFITPQYEQAKIQESKDTPTVQILDEAKVPIKRIKPKRAYFVIFMNVLMFMLGVIFIIFIEYYGQIQRGERDSNDRMAQIIQILGDDVKSFFRPFRKRA
jgi:uncharacterized protein involved in exopolysaccharide biosynthesis